MIFPVQVLNAQHLSTVPIPSDHPQFPHQTPLLGVPARRGYVVVQQRWWGLRLESDDDSRGLIKRLVGAVVRSNRWGNGQGSWICGSC